jgi:hypothetical protein
MHKILQLVMEKSWVVDLPSTSICKIEISKYDTDLDDSESRHIKSRYIWLKISIVFFFKIAPMSKFWLEDYNRRLLFLVSFWRNFVSYEYKNRSAQRSTIGAHENCNTLLKYVITRDYNEIVSENLACL